MIVTISVMLFIFLVLATGAERIYELAVSTRNANRAFGLGGVEYGRGHLPAMIALHTALLVVKRLGIGLSGHLGRNGIPE